jgi:hypothetical protein
METVQQSELQGRQHAWWRPLDTMAFCSSSSDMSNSDGFFPQLQWDPVLWYLGVGVVAVPAVAAGDDHRGIEDELGLFFPMCTSQCGLFLPFRFSPLSLSLSASCSFTVSSMAEAVVLTCGCRVAGMESPGSREDDETVMPEDQLDELLQVS